jgi:hypothetical protein
MNGSLPKIFSVEWLHFLADEIKYYTFRALFWSEYSLEIPEIAQYSFITKRVESIKFLGLQISKMVHTDAQSWRTHYNAYFPSGGWKGLAWALKSSKSYTVVPLRASWLAASLLDMEIALPSIAWRYRWWCGQPMHHCGRAQNGYTDYLSWPLYLYIFSTSLSLYGHSQCCTHSCTLTLQHTHTNACFIWSNT